MTTDAVSIDWYGPTTTYGGREYAELILELRDFLATLASARPDIATIAELAGVLSGLNARLKPSVVEEAEQVYGRRTDLVGRGQATLPPVTFTHHDDTFLQGTVRFGRFYLGRNGVIHGGAITFLFDEIAGRLANLGNRPIARTAYVRTDFRSIAAIDTDLIVSARILREEGRKRFLRVELRDGDRLCAEGEVLMIALLPGQT